MSSIIRFPVVKAQTGLSHSTIYAKIASGDFPRPIKLGARAVGWLQSEINDWLSEQIAKSRGEAITSKDSNLAEKT